MKSLAPPPVTPRRKVPPRLGFAAVLVAARADAALPARLPARTTPPVAARSSRRESDPPLPSEVSPNGCCSIRDSSLPVPVQMDCSYREQSARGVRREADARERRRALSRNALDPGWHGRLTYV